MCQKQINALVQIGVSVEVKNNNNHLICQKGNLIKEVIHAHEDEYLDTPDYEDFEDDGAYAEDFLD